MAAKEMRLFSLFAGLLAVANGKSVSGSSSEGTAMTPQQSKFHKYCVGNLDAHEEAALPALQQWATELSIPTMQHDSVMEMCEKIHLGLELGDAEMQSNGFRFKRCESGNGKESFKPMDPKICDCGPGPLPKKPPTIDVPIPQMPCDYNCDCSAPLEAAAAPPVDCENLIPAYTYVKGGMGIGMSSFVQPSEQARTKRACEIGSKLRGFGEQCIHSCYEVNVKNWEQLKPGVLGAAQFMKGGCAQGCEQLDLMV